MLHQHKNRSNTIRYSDMKEKIFDVWLEGHAVTGNRATANFLGSYKSETFKNACKKAMILNNYDLSLYNSERNTYWCCKFYNNEQDARKSFG